MALPKELRAALDAWKEGKGDFPDGLDSSVIFENDGAFMAAVNKKLTPAQKKAKDEAQAELLRALDIEDPAELEKVKERLKAADGSLSDLDKARSDLAKATKKLADADKQIASLGGFRSEVLKDRALTPHLTKIREDLRDVIAENLRAKLVIADDGKVTAPDGVEIEKHLEELIKAKPSLKAPDFKSGAGTSPQGGKAVPGAGGGEQPNPNPGNGTAEPLSLHQAMVAAMTAQAASRSSGQ